MLISDGSFFIRFFKFFLIGLGCFCVDAGITNLGFLAGQPIFGKLIGLALALCMNFFLNTAFTFPSKQQEMFDIVEVAKRFVVCTMFTTTANALTFWLLLRLVAPENVLELNAIFILNAGLFMIINYKLYSSFVWGELKHAS